MKKFYLVFTAFLIVYICYNQKYNEIPSDSFRIRIIPSTNSKKDIKVKLLIKNNLDKIVYPIIKDAKSTNEINSILKENLDYINKKIFLLLNEYSINEKYSINVGLNYFPEKKYKNIVYKSGQYKSLVIKLGKAKGDNFWCVLYPPLCLANENNNSKYHILIKDLLFK